MKEFWFLMSPWKKFKFIVSILVSIFIVIFAITNWQEAEVNFIFFKVRISITLLITVCLLAGFISSTLFDYRKHRLKELEISKLKAQIKDLEEAKIISE
jgi:uncharacterized integral membrane protein